MADILQSAQKLIDDAAKQTKLSADGLDPTPSATGTPLIATNQTSSQLDPIGQIPTPLTSANQTTIPPQPQEEQLKNNTKPNHSLMNTEVLPEEKSNTEISYPDKVQTDNPLVGIVDQLSQTVTVNSDQQPSNVPPKDNQNNNSDNTPPEPTKPKKSKIGFVLTAFLFLAVTLPLSVFYISQQKQLTDNRGRAADEGKTGQACETINAIECQSDNKLHWCNPNTKLWSTGDKSCNQGDVQCKIEKYECRGSECFATKANPCADGKSCCDVKSNVSNCPNACGTGQQTSCSGYDINDDTGKCNTAGACREYGECCGPGRSRTVKAACLPDGREKFDIVSSCGKDVSGECGDYNANATPCKTGEFYWPKKDGGDNACHDISGPRQPGGASGSCTKQNGCTKPNNGCLVGYKCTQTELTPQGFCLKNKFVPQANKNYQNEADSSCLYIQVDAFIKNKCDKGVTETTPHDGQIKYEPNNPDCIKGGEKTTPPPPPPSEPPSPTEEPIAECKDIKIYKNGEKVKPNTLEAGDKVEIAVVGNNANKARIRINGGKFTETNKKNDKGEFTLAFTVPTGVNKFTIEAEVLRKGKWQ